MRLQGLPIVRVSEIELPEFLLARIVDRERQLELPEFFEENSARGPGWGNRGDCPICGAYQFSGTEPVTKEAWWEHAENVHQRTRVLARCDADRRIVENTRLARRAMGEAPLEQLLSAQDGPAAAYWRGLDYALSLLALPYADHPDWREEWRP